MLLFLQNGLLFHVTHAQWWEKSVDILLTAQVFVFIIYLHVLKLDF